ncbi:MAG: hypothetical protein KC636_08330 [Myxococcales bacterium]|nr:hypothetical protein [Myxococcales bacterium]
MSSRWLLVVVATAPLASGCASACQKVAAAKQELARAPQPARGGPHVVASIPFDTVDRLLSLKVQKIRPVSVTLPDLSLPQLPGLKLGLGRVTVALESVRATPAPDDQLGIRLTLALRSGQRTITRIALDASVRPQIDAQAGRVEVALAPRDIANLRPTLPPEGRKQLADFLWAEVPDSVRRLVSRGRVDQLADTVASDLLGRSFGTIQKQLLSGAEPFAQFTLHVPELLPIDAVHLRSQGGTGPGALELAIRARVAAPGVASATTRSPSLPAGLVHVRMSAAAVTALANDAMARGVLPARFDAQGEPSPQGPFTVALAWQSGAKPLRMHTFRESGDCIYIEFAGTPALSVASGQLEVAVADGSIERTAGKAKLRAAIWFSGIGRRTFSFTRALAAGFTLEVPGMPLQSSAAAVTTEGDDFVLGMTLAPARPGG